MGSDSFIVGVTGNMFPEDVSYFKESGANNVLGKPLRLEELTDLWMEYGVGSYPDHNEAADVDIEEGMTIPRASESVFTALSH